jgi:uncharacterized repeat protein (TIGR01451 family)
LLAALAGLFVALAPVRAWQAAPQLSVTKIVQSAVSVASLPAQTGPLGPASASNGAGTTGTAVIPGTRLSYRITVANSGPNDLANLRVLDTLPANAKFVTVTQSGGFATIFTCQPPIGNPDPNGLGGLVQCTAPAMAGAAPNNVATLDVTVDLDPAAKADLVNKADAYATIATLNQADSATTTLTTPVAPVSDLTLTKSHGPDPVHAGGLTTYTLTLRNNGPSVAAMAALTDNLPAGQSLAAPADVSAAPGFTCSGLSGAIACQAASLAAGATAVVKLPVKIADNVAGGVHTNTAAAASMSADPTPAAAADPLTVLVKISNDPGRPIPISTEADDQKAGSVLFFPIYTSDAVNANLQNTRISITNTSGKESACVHLFALDGSSCAELDGYTCLTPNQTTTFLASDFDPGATGYLMAVAVDCDTGAPIGFNSLLGDEYVKFASGHAANLGALAAAAVSVFPAGNPAGADGFASEASAQVTATLKFDGLHYNRLPRVLAADNIPSPADGNASMLIVNRIGGNLLQGGSLIGGIAGVLYDDTENPYTFSTNQQSCQFRTVLSNTFPRTFTPFNQVLFTGHAGWMKFFGVDDARGSEKALFGAMINFNAAANANSAAYNQGHNLHYTTLTDKAEIVVPVVFPNC